MEIILLTQYKPTSDLSLLKNCQNKYITEIYLLVDQIYDLHNIIPREYISKIKQIKIGMTYKDIFTYYNNNLLGKICILANNDIYFNDSLYIIEHVNFDFDIFFSLCNKGSYTLIWKLNEVSKLLDNKYNCNNNICNLLLEDDFTILNSLLININSITNIDDNNIIDSIIDIPDKYTYEAYNINSLDTMKQTTVIKKNVELIPPTDYMVKVSSVKQKTKIGWIPRNDDINPFIQFNLNSSEKIPYIDIQGYDSGHVKGIKILYSIDDSTYEMETTEINISNYIKRIYFKDPIYCNVMRINILGYEGILSLRVNIYKMTVVDNKYELIPLHPCQIQKYDDYIEYNFENMYNIMIIGLEHNGMVRIDYMLNDICKTRNITLNKVIKLNKIMKCTKLKIYNPNIAKLYCKQIQRYNIYNDIIVKSHLNSMVYSIYADYDIYKLINDEVKINAKTNVSDIMGYYHNNTIIQNNYKTFDNYYNYVMKYNFNNTPSNKMDGISLLVCGTYNSINNIDSWLKQSINELVIIDWNSDIEFYDLIQSYNDKRIKYIRVENESKFIKTYAQNLGVNMCSYNKICKLDSNVILEDNFFENHPLRENMFYVDNNSNIYLWIDDFFTVYGYNETLVNSGWEDNDLIIRLLLLGLQKRLFNCDMIRSMQTYENKIYMHANKLLIEKLPIWNHVYSSIEYNIIDNTDYYILERTDKEKTEDMMSYFDIILNQHIEKITNDMTDIIKITTDNCNMYNIFMHIYNMYKSQQIYNDINTYTTENINLLLNSYDKNNKISYNYYKEFSITTIKMILFFCPNEYYVPPFRLLLSEEYKIDKSNWYGIIKNYLDQAYYEKNNFYNNHPQFEWVSYAINNNIDYYEDSITSFIYNKNNNYNKIKYIIFNDYLEKSNVNYNNNFISFIHNPPCIDNNILRDMNRDNKTVLKNKDNLKILVSFSEYHKKYIDIILDKNIIVNNLLYPIELSTSLFNFDKFLNNNNKKLYILGSWLQKYNIFIKIKYEKVIVMKFKNDTYLNNEQLKEVTNCTIMKHLKDKDYENIFSSNIVFLDTYDMVYCNVVLECIANHTPLLVRYNSSIVEYLGEDYPFYFINTNDAMRKLNDMKLIKETHDYLKEHYKSGIFNYDTFNRKLNDIIYMNA